MPVETLAPPKTHRTPTDADRRKIRAEFVAGLGSGPQLARQYGFSYYTVRDWIDGEGWQKLKEQRDRQELAKLNTYPEPTDQAPVIAKPTIDPESRVAKLESHLKRVDDMLETEQDARNIAQLTRARGELEESLYVAIHGAKPGTMRPSTGKGQRRSTPTSPVEVPDGLEQRQTSPVKTQPVKIEDDYAI